MELLGTKACPDPGLKELCANVMFLVAGFDEKNLNLVQHVFCGIIKKLMLMYLNRLVFQCMWLILQQEHQ